jgi:hypothetical protein
MVAPCCTHSFRLIVYGWGELALYHMVWWVGVSSPPPPITTGDTPNQCPLLRFAIKLNGNFETGPAGAA